MTTLTRQGLNRAILARQMLLTREKTTALRAIERLVGLQAQEAKPPFIGLWSRVAEFRREHLTRLLLRRKVVRATLMRGTLHLMSAQDFVDLRATLQPVLTLAMQRAKGLDVDRLVAVAREYFEEQPRTFNDLRAWLLKRFPKGDERAMGYAVRMHLPLVQAPSDAEWGFPGSAAFAVAETWLGRPLGSEQKLQLLVLRYLAGFGPATPNDVKTWSGLRWVAEVLEALRPRLRTFRDERGRELFDLPKAPRPPEDTTAPIRFIPEYDNLILSHADRTRIVADAHRSSIVTRNLQVRATFLVDGFVAGTWKIERKKASATLLIAPFEALTSKTREETGAEGNQLLRFAEPGAERFEVQFGKHKDGP
jgi:hypothetical protein